MIKGKVYKIHSDFYYVKTDLGTYECKLLQVIKKQKNEVYVGDFVELEQIIDNSKQAFIAKILPRKNFVMRPKAANIDKLIVVCSVKEPDLDFEQLDRYLALAKLCNVDASICFNKNDLLNDDKFIEKIYSMYEPLGYEIIFTSAKDELGIDDFEELISGKTCVLCGVSGVGKSSLLNSISDAKARTQAVSSKTGRGIHTTRHCELKEIKLSDNRIAEIVDTPGFSNLKFDFLMPDKIACLFPEFEPYLNSCKFNTFC